MNLTNNLDLSNETDYQNIYSSQLYGTFFMIFAKFHTEPCVGGYKIKSIALRLLNYKGPINLGINRAKLVPKTVNKKKSGILKIELQALKQSNCDYPAIIEPDMECSLGGSIYVMRSLIPFTAGNTNTIFDNEYFYREGFELVEGEIVSKVPETREPEPGNDYDDSEKDTIIDEAFGGWICPRSINNIAN